MKEWLSLAFSRGREGRKGIEQSRTWPAASGELAAAAESPDLVSISSILCSKHLYFR